jgi:hypothetical protein
MRRKKITVELTEAELDQLRQYIHERDCGENRGWYYGNKEHFENRHKHLTDAFTKALESFPGYHPPITSTHST